MLYTHFTEKLLGLQGVNVTNVEDTNEGKYVYIEMKRKTHICPCCRSETNTIHDYRTQRVKDTPAFGKMVIIILRKRRYRCPHCGKRFFEENTFLPKYHRMTNRLVAFVINQLRDERSFSSVARDVNLSVPTVIRIFDFVSYSCIQALPSAISIDEFKGNTEGEKYQCILTDPVHHVVLDILPQRYEHYLTAYFRRFSHEERQRVGIFVNDMWKPYAEMASTWFQNALPVVDKYHWVRQVIWAFERIRKEEQKQLSPQYRKYFKRSRELLLKRFRELTDEQKQQVNVMLYASVNICRAHGYKEKFLQILDCTDRDSAKAMMKDWIESAESCGLEPFEKCAKTMLNWQNGILNSFSVPYTNGFTEGCNNKIKVLKRNAYGYRNFKRFRNRILHMFSHQETRKQAAAI